MSYQFSISDIGLRLIKAYEGFWPEARELASGGYVVGFGHRVLDGEVSGLTEDEAEDVLKSDLAPIEDFINSQVHASMTQSQFDALCSLVFSIGPKAFLSSNMLHDLNRGQVIEASNGFDMWRKGNINGRVYVVDALVRRRTAEKALFLRPTQRIARAPRFELAAIRDHDVPENAEKYGYAAPLNAAPIFTQPDPEVSAEVEPIRQTLSSSIDPVLYSNETAEELSLENLVQAEAAQPEAIVEEAYQPAVEKTSLRLVEETAPADPEVEEPTQPEEMLEVDEPALQVIGEIDDRTAESRSPIAAAAAEVSGRLDALIENKTETSPQPEWPDSLMSDEKARRTTKTDLVIDELQQDDALREQIARESQYNTDRYDDYIEVQEKSRAKGIWAFGLMIVVGLAAAIAGFFINARGAVDVLGENGPFLTIAAMLIGGLLIAGGVLYLVKAIFSRD